MKLQSIFWALTGLMFTINSCISAPESAASRDASSLEGRIEECRVALRDLENLRESAVKSGNTELFDTLFFNASLLLKDIEGKHSESELLFMLGQCQGIIDSLALVLQGKKYRGDRSKYGSARNALNMKPSKNQAVARPNAVKLEPMESLEDLEEREKNSAANVQPIYHIDTRQRAPMKSEHLSEEHDILER